MTRAFFGVLLTGIVITCGCVGEKNSPQTDRSKTDDGSSAEILAQLAANELETPVKLESDGRPIDIGTLSGIGHAGPLVADIDCDGDKDLLVGDFPGYFWYFENTGNDDEPEYVSQGKLQAGGEDAKTPVY